MKKKNLIEAMFVYEFRRMNRLSNTIRKARISRDNLKRELYEKITEELLSGDLSLPTQRFLNLKTGNKGKKVIEILVQHLLDKERWSRGMLISDHLRKFLLNNLDIIELNSLPDVLNREFSLIEFKLHDRWLSIEMITPKPSKK
jgi:hypothetical protein